MRERGVFHPCAGESSKIPHHCGLSHFLRDMSRETMYTHAAGIWRIRGKPPPAAPPAEPARRRGGLAAGGLGDSWFNILEDSI